MPPAPPSGRGLELTPDQVVDLEDADVVLYVGAGFQPAVAEIAEDRDGQPRPHRRHRPPGR